jgi:hypothetical protein
MHHPQQPQHQRKQRQQRAFTGRTGFPTEPNAPQVSPPPQPEAMSEDQAREKFGVSAPAAPPRPTVLCMRQTLMLSPEDLIAFFDETPAAKVAERIIFAEMDFVVPPEMLQHRIDRLKKVIAASKEILKGLSKHIMKLKRTKDDILDKPIQEKFKREETARMARSNAKLYRYRMALRDGNYHEKIWRDQIQPVYFRDLVDDVMVFEELGPSYYKNDKFKTPPTGAPYWTTSLTRDVKFRVFDISRYEVMMRLDQSTLRLAGLTEEEQHRTWANVQRWENAIIAAAVFHGVLHPRPDLMEMLSLTPFAQAALAASETIEADDAENALALKTGGACFGGRIKSAGYRYGTSESKSGNSFRRRSLESFDKGKALATWDDTRQTADTGSSLHDIHDDAESYDPR